MRASWLVGRGRSSALGGPRVGAERQGRGTTSIPNVWAISSVASSTGEVERTG